MREAGTMLPMLGGLVFIALAVIGVATDLALLHGAYLRIANVADAAAEAGAASLDVDQLHAGVLLLDEPAAVATAEMFVHLNAPDAWTSTEVSPTQVCATVGVSHRTIALVFIGVGTVEVRARSCAEPAVG